jgi:hypothetical protein
MLRWISALSVTVMLAAACGPPVETEPRSQPPEPEPDELVHPDAVWFDVLQVSPTAPDYGWVELAEDADRGGQDEGVDEVGDDRSRMERHAKIQRRRTLGTQRLQQIAEAFETGDPDLFGLVGSVEEKDVDETDPPGSVVDCGRPLGESPRAAGRTEDRLAACHSQKRGWRSATAGD